MFVADDRWWVVAATALAALGSEAVAAKALVGQAAAMAVVKEEAVARVAAKAEEARVAAQAVGYTCTHTPHQFGSSRRGPV